MPDNASPELIAGDVVVTVPYTLTRQRLSDLLCTAVEGGTGYWAEVDQVVRTPNLDYVSVRFHELEASAGDLKTVVVTLDTLAEGVRRCALSKTYAWHF